MKGTMKNVRVEHNTFWDTNLTSISFSGDSLAENSVIANNIVYQRNGKVAWIENRQGIDMHNNFWMNTTSVKYFNAIGIGDLYGDVRMQTKPTYDPVTFRLSNRSKAINSGNSSIVYDFEGKARNMPDIGAIEFT